LPLLINISICYTVWQDAAPKLSEKPPENTICASEIAKRCCQFRLPAKTPLYL